MVRLVVLLQPLLVTVRLYVPDWFSVAVLTPVAIAPLLKAYVVPPPAVSVRLFVEQLRVVLGLAVRVATGRAVTLSVAAAEVRDDGPVDSVSTLRYCEPFKPVLLVIVNVAVVTPL